MLELELRSGGANLQQIAQVRRSRVSGLRGEIRKRRKGNRSALLRRSNHGLKRTHNLRLPAVRFGFIGFAEAHEAVIGQIADLNGGNDAALAFRRLVAAGIGAPGLPYLRVNLLESVSANGRRYSEKALVDNGRRKPDGIEKVRRVVAVEHADAHLRHDFGEAQFEGAQQVLLALFTLQVPRRLQSQPGADRARAHAQQHGYVMNFAAITGIHCESHFGADTSVGERVVDRAGGHGHRHRKRVGRGFAVREDEHGRAFSDKFHGARSENIHGDLKGRIRRIHAIENGVGHVGGLLVLAVFQRVHLRQREQGRM